MRSRRQKPEVEARPLKLTAAEKEHIRRERHRIALDATDWDAEAVVTNEQLLEMSPHMRDRFTPPTWVYDTAACVHRNTNHNG